jgi:hypothetical protein
MSDDRSGIVVIRRRLMTRLGSLSLGLLALGAGWLAADPADAAVLKRIHTGERNVANAAGVTVPLDLPDASKAFVVCHPRTTNTNSNRRVTCVLSDNLLTIDGGNNVGATVTVSFYVAEFDSGVLVQRGTSVFAQNQLTPPVAPSIAAVDCSASFIVMAGEQTNAGAINGNDEQYTFRAILGTFASPCTTGTTSTLSIERLDGATAADATAAWQVVTMDSAVVQRGVAQIANNALTATAAIAAVDTATSFAQITRTAGSAVAGVENRYLTRVTFSASNQLTFTRGAQTGAANTFVNIAWEVVSFIDGTTVVSGTTQGSGTHSTMSAALSGVSTGRAVPFLTMSTAVGGNNIFNSTSWSAQVLSTPISQLLFTRGVSNGNVVPASWFVVSFTRCTNDPLCQVGASAGSGQARVTATTYTDPDCPLAGCGFLVLRRTSSITDAPANGTQYAVGGTIGSSTVVYNTHETTVATANGANATSLTVGSTTGFPSSCTSNCRAYVFDATTLAVDEFTYTGTTATRFTGIPSSGALALLAHPVGSIVRAYPGSQAGGDITIPQTTTSAALGLTATTGGIDAASTTIPVASTANFATSGTAYLDQTDEFTYTGTTATSFTGVSGIDASYAAGAEVNSFSMTIPVGSTADFPAAGTAYVSASDSFTYTGTTATEFIGVRGVSASAASGATITAEGFRETGLTNGTTYFYKVFPKTGSSTYVTSLTNSQSQVTAVPDAGQTTWSFAITSGSSMNPPIAGNTGLFVSTNNTSITTVNPADGTQISQANTRGAVQGSVGWFPESAGAGEAIVGADSVGMVYSVDALSGQTNWSAEFSNLQTGDFIQGGVSTQVRDYSDATFQGQFSTDLIYVATTGDGTNTANHAVSAFRADTGELVWEFRPNATGTGSPMGEVLAAPWVDYSRNRLYVTSRNGVFGGQNGLWVLRTVQEGPNAAGTLVTSFGTVGDAQIAPSVSYDEQVLYLADVPDQSAGFTPGTLHAFNLNAGTPTQKWAGGAAIQNPLGYAKGYIWEDFGLNPGGERRLYVVTDDNTRDGIRCIQDDGSSGSQCWHRPHPASGGRFRNMVLGDDAIYVGSSDGKLYQIDYVTGSILTCYAVSGSPDLGDASTSDGQQIFLGSAAGRVYRIELPLPVVSCP